MAQRKSELQKIGAEGFAILDEYYIRKDHQQPRRHVNQVIIPANAAAQANKEINNVCIDSYRAAQLYGGTLIAEYRKSAKKPLTRLPKFYN